MEKLNKHSTGMAVGLFLALFHLLWAILVATKVVKPFIDWVLSLYAINFSYKITEFSLGAAIGLVVFTFVCGYVSGWVFAAIWNYYRK
jgi:hypothetical protein